MDNADLMYISLQRSEPFDLSSIDEYDKYHIRSKIIAFKVDVELQARHINKPSLDCTDREFDDYCSMCDSISNCITIPENAQVVHICSYKGEGMGFALYDDVKQLPVFISKQHSFYLFDC